MRFFLFILFYLIIGTGFSQITGTLTDARDGKVYKTVVIGTQTWMSENLNTSNFRNGDPIPEVKTQKEWLSANENQKPAWCYYNNDPKNGAKYGKLYNWYAVIDERGLAPKGMHIPSNSEWNLLTDYLGKKLYFGDYRDESKSLYVGKMMKSEKGWRHKGNGNNESGFLGFANGARTHEGEFFGFGDNVLWWSSTEFNDTNGCIYYLNFADDFIVGHKGNKGGGIDSMSKGLKCNRLYFICYHHK
jgi:uncharacterized protein (TIGR02145 family)